MLKRSVHYSRNTPIEINVLSIRECRPHYHEDLEIIFVIRGSVKFKMGRNSEEQLTEGDIRTINGGDIHRVSSDETNMIMAAHFSCKYFSRYHENLKNSFFISYKKNENYSVLKELLVKMLKENLIKGNGYIDRMIEISHNIISCLKSNFSSFMISEGAFILNNKEKKLDIERMTRIISYIYENYDRKIKIEEIAKREHLSVFYLSHTIKRLTGLSFQELVCFIRAEESEKLLLETDYKISYIAKLVGFSAIRYYTKYFELWFRMNPKMYRKVYSLGQSGEKETRESYQKYKAEEIIKVLDKYIKKESCNKNSDVRILNIDLNKKIEFVKSDEIFIEEEISKSKNKLFRKLYKGMCGLNENILHTDRNYIVTSPDRGNIERLTLLFCNFNNEDRDEELCKTENLRYLINIDGISGKYEVVRYRATLHEDDFYSPKCCKDVRFKMQSQWAMLPQVNVECINILERLSLIINLDTESAEIILLDRKDNVVN